MKKRGITEKIVIETLKNPKKVVKGYGGRKIAHKMFNKEDKLEVITAYLTSKINI